MQLNRIIALILVAVCFLAAIAGVQRRQIEASIDFSALNRRENYLERVALNGIISGIGGASGAMAVRDRLLELKDEDNVKGVLLAINSPGGTVGASKELYEAVKQLQEVKPVVVSMLDQATSGGYYAASPATKIYANPGALTGSIGVILSNLNLKELLDRVGIEAQTIKTGPYKDIFSPYRSISESERQFLQELLQNTYQNFVSDVAAGRKTDIEAIRKLADGRVFTGQQAKENGLVDDVGTEAVAVEALRQLARDRFQLPASEELPLRSIPPSFERIVEDLFGSGVQSQGQSTLRRALGAIAQRWLGKERWDSTSELTSFEPPILLVPEWYSHLGL